MCDNCGCSHALTHQHAHAHDHGHVHTHEHAHEQKPVRRVEVEQNILAHNDATAAANLAFFRQHRMLAVNIISSPGAGKTYLLEKTLLLLKDRLKCAVITGDLKTDNDAKRLEGKGAFVQQIETISACHLDAAQISAFLPALASHNIALLFIENVGNLVCPSAFNLGEHFKIALLSVTEGEDKPLKYPSLFTQAPLSVVTKIDLLPHLDCDLALIRENLHTVHPGQQVLELSAKSGAGMEGWVDYLLAGVRDAAAW